MKDQQIGKREIERDDLGMFLDAYRLATGETFTELYDSETPDFIGRDEDDRIVGIEITTLRFAPYDRFWRHISPPAPHDIDAWLRLLELIHRKSQTLTKGHWSECERSVLVIMMVDVSIADITAGGAETDTPKEGNFDEVWLADHTQVDAFGAVDLFAVVHSTLAGHFATGNRGQKPYG